MVYKALLCLYRFRYRPTDLCNVNWLIMELVYFYQQSWMGRIFVIYPSLLNITSSSLYLSLSRYTCSTPCNVQRTLRETQAQVVSPLVPREFSALGYLERLDAYLMHQDFCSTASTSGAAPSWPPMSSLTVVVSEVRESCVEACFRRGTSNTSTARISSSIFCVF